MAQLFPDGPLRVSPAIFNAGQTRGFMPLCKKDGLVRGRGRVEHRRLGSNRGVDEEEHDGDVAWVTFEHALLIDLRDGRRRVAKTAVQIISRTPY